MLRSKQELPHPTATLRDDSGVNDGLYANIYRPCLMETADVQTANKVSTPALQKILKIAQ